MNPSDNPKSVPVVPPPPPKCPPFDDPWWHKDDLARNPSTPADGHRETDAVLDRLLDLDAAVRELLARLDAAPGVYNVPTAPVARVRELVREGGAA